MKALVVSDSGLRAEEREAHQILQSEPLRSIPLNAGMHMMIHAREAKGPQEVNGAAVSLLLSCSDLKAQDIPMVTGDAVVMRPDGEVSPSDAAALVVMLLDDGQRIERDREIGLLP